MTKIENENQYRRAVERVEELLPLVNDHTPQDDKNYVELVLLSNLVADYSDEHFALEPPSLLDIIKLRMYEMGLNRKSLAALLGTSDNGVEEIIDGKKEPSLSLARTISQKLNIAPEVVLGV